MHFACELVDMLHGMWYTFLCEMGTGYLTYQFEVQWGRLSWFAYAQALSVCVKLRDDKN